ncbi:MAG: 50S ribosomal protein L11 [Candidatus Micrarchaeota archaeon]|nr:50S ribosomal protein L11 [Candidatus Micrarchaeota archaeon]MCX8154556.1 50S ribosomal protein L11 [Candidatus Micrarchaeota archaeon]
MAKKEIKAMVDGGAAKPTPPLGPALSAAKLPVQKVIDEINRRTAYFKGIKVPVVIIYEEQNYEIEVGIPPTTELIKREAGLEKGASKHDAPVGNVPLKKIIELAKSSMDKSNTFSVRNRVKELLGTCVSMGITVDGKNPKDLIKEIDRLEDAHFA